MFNWKTKKPILFKVTEPNSIPYRTHPACAKMAADPDPPPVILVPDCRLLARSPALYLLARSRARSLSLSLSISLSFSFPPLYLSLSLSLSRSLARSLARSRARARSLSLSLSLSFSLPHLLARSPALSLSFLHVYCVLVVRAWTYEYGLNQMYVGGFFTGNRPPVFPP